MRTSRHGRPRGVAARRRRALGALAFTLTGALLAAATAPRRALAQDIFWDGGALTSLWADADNWDFDRLPESGESVAGGLGATILYSGFLEETTIASFSTFTSDLIIENGGTLRISELLSFTAGGSVTVSGTLEVPQIAAGGTVSLVGGTLIGAQIASPSSLLFGSGESVLDGVTLNAAGGPLNIFSSTNTIEALVRVANGITANGATFNVGVMGTDGVLLFDSTEQTPNVTFDNAVVNVGSAPGDPITRGILSFGAGFGTTESKSLTLGPDLSVQGRFAYIGDISGFNAGPNMTLVNQTSLVSQENGFWNIVVPNLLNQGTIGATNGSSLDILASDGDVVNDGTISATGGGFVEVVTVLDLFNNGTILASGTDSGVLLDVLDFENNGTLRVENTGLDFPGLEVEVFGQFTNNGLIEVTGDGTFAVLNVNDEGAPEIAEVVSSGGITVGEGATLQVGLGESLDDAVDLRQTGGTTTIDGTLLMGPDGFNFYNLEGGTLGGTGTLVGDLFQTGGVLSGGNSVGTLTLDGDYFLLSGTLLLEIESDTSFDILRLTTQDGPGGVFLGEGSNLEVRFLNGYLPTGPLSLFRFFEFSGGDEILGDFASITSNATGFDYSFDATTGTLAVTAAATVPEPGAGLLLLAGAAVPAAVLRRRRRAA